MGWYLDNDCFLPHSAISADHFGMISDYVITDEELCGKLITLYALDVIITISTTNSIAISITISITIPSNNHPQNGV